MSVPTSWAEALSQAENSSQRDPELWAKCFAQANGDEGVAKAAYVNALMTSAKPTNHHPLEGMGYCPMCGAECQLDCFFCQACKCHLSGVNKPKKSKPESVRLGAKAPLPSITAEPQVVRVHTSKSRGIYIILALFFGLLGVHNFYAGRYGIGAAQLVITATLGWFVVGIVITVLWSIYDMFTVKADGSGELFA